MKVISIFIQLFSLVMQKVCYTNSYKPVGNLIVFFILNDFLNKIKLTLELTNILKNKQPEKY